MRFCKTLPAWTTGIPALSGMRVDLSPEGKVILASIIPKFVFRGLRACPPDGGELVEWLVIPWTEGSAWAGEMHVFRASRKRGLSP